MTEAVSRLDRITVDPLICHGAPTIRGMRLRVQDVLELLASGMTYEEILTPDPRAVDWVRRAVNVQMPSVA